MSDMPDQLLLGNFPKGQQTNRTAFNIDNNSFPTLYNAYVWRGRAKRKRGTQTLARLQRQVQLLNLPTPPITTPPWQYGPLTLSGGEGNFLTFLTTVPSSIPMQGLTPSPNSISGITNATSAVVTITAHHFLVGQIVEIIDVTGMTQINGGFYTITATGVNTITLNVNSTAFGVYTGSGHAYLADGPSIVPGTISVLVSGNTYTDPNADGVLVGTPTGTGTINYTTGTIIITGGGSSTLTGTLSYFPSFAVLGLEDFVSNFSSSKFPLLIGFDDTYAYQINQNGAPFFYSISYYKNTNNPVIWSNDDANQFWSTNYQSAFWATNNKAGFHFLNGTYISGSGSNVITFTFTSLAAAFTTLVVGDVLWFNEWIPPPATVTGVAKSATTVVTAVNTFVVGQKVTFTGVRGMTQLNQGIYTITAATGTNFTISVDSTTFTDYVGPSGIANLDPSNITNTLNGVNGVVSSVAGALTGTYVVTFTSDGVPAPQTVSGTGIAVMLTNQLVGQDGIRFYDGDPTGGTGLPTGTGLGWVNFSPPLTALVCTVNDQLEAKYYLVGALAIVPFKDRLMFFGPQVQTSTGPVIQLPLQDGVIYSWNGTPYYNALVPTNLTNSEDFDPSAYYIDQAGKGGEQYAGVSQPIVTVTNNEDVLLIGFGGAGKKTRLIYTSNDLQPFLFYLINSELPSSATFSGVTFDKGGLDIGPYGLTMTTQQGCERIDLDIPDTIFQIQSLNSGTSRINAIRDFYREWVYFTYPTGSGVITSGSWKYPTQSLLYNYRDNTWGVLRENYTHQGTFRRSSNFTWKTVPFKTWTAWQEPWNAGSSIALFPSVIGGTPQGYVLVKSQGTFEAPSAYISAISNNGGFVQITSQNHCVNVGNSFQNQPGDYLFFGGFVGLVINIINADNFVIDIPFFSTASISAITSPGTVTVLTINKVGLPIGPVFFPGQRVTITGVVGMTQLNGNTYTILSSTDRTITLNVNSSAFTPYISRGTVTLVDYIGLGSFAKLSQPLIQTKQFPAYWEQGYKVRIGSQKYLLDTTALGQVTVNIYLSQDSNDTFNIGPIIPDGEPENSALIYSQLVYTCPESTNIGLTPANVNLQMPVAIDQDNSPAQIWHRMNTSLIGDTIQLGITLSDAQMRNITYATSEITLHAAHLAMYRGGVLS